MNPPAANNQYWLLNSVNGWRLVVPPQEPFHSAGGSLLFLGAGRDDVSVSHGLLQNADGSLTRAALFLDSNQSLLSRHLNALERECKARLFNRTGRGVAQRGRGAHREDSQG